MSRLVAYSGLDCDPKAITRSIMELSGSSSIEELCTLLRN
jgi:hypothetical protein